MPSVRSLRALWCLGLLVGARATLGAEIRAKGLGEPGPLQALRIDTGRTIDGRFVLCGQDARQQLAVTGEYASGQARDLSRAVTYEVSPAGLARVSAEGQVVPLANGQATITARAAGGVAASTSVLVTRFDHDLPLNFDNQVRPILTKAGCNSGACHGKAGGQNGFRLSLLGFDPLEDHECLTKEGRGRRVFPAAAEQSLLLLKPVGAVPHAGGVRLQRDSPSYRVLRRWIAQGMPFGDPKDPTVDRIEVFPAQRTLPQQGQQQMIVVAHYSDGSTEDVTSQAQYELNSADLAKVSSAGLVNVFDLPGNVAIMARYHGHVAAFRASIPLGAPVDSLPAPKNFIDELVFQQLKTLGLPPSGVCDDATFVRRVTIDIAGRLPTAAEATAFLSDRDPQKRDKWIDTLLASTDYADYFTHKWILLLRSRRVSTSDARGTVALHDWIRDALHANRPYDEIVRELLTASGDIEGSPLVNWWREIKETNDQVENTAQIFLGLRIACARCHHHPFENWSQQDYYAYSAFFSRVGRKYDRGYAANVERIFYDRGTASAKHPKTEAILRPTGLGGKPLDVPLDQDPREALADWMAAKENPFFTRALVNRYWKHFFGRGLVDPEDDMRITNPPSNPELLDALAHHFAASGFDLKELVRTICRSQVYQLSAEPNDDNLNDKQNFARFYPRRLPAEVLLDSIDQVALSHSNFGGAPALPPDLRAVQLPHDPFPGSYFLQIFGMPEGTTACECERTSSANLAQSLHLFNSTEVRGKLSSHTGRAAVLAADKGRSPEAKVREIYMLAYSRAPSSRQLDLALRHLSKAKDEKTALEDILWALLNTKEFLFNH
ncbi:MAG: DUF1553 domain-containing protein [Isosphaeraceae bacterium]|nr:DUF1553 domain-containing protein [Isosphaeraceae bacterium]